MSDNDITFGMIALFIGGSIVVAIIGAVLAILTAMFNWFHFAYTINAEAYGFLTWYLFAGLLCSPYGLFKVYTEWNFTPVRLCFWAMVLLVTTTSIYFAFTYNIRPMNGLWENSAWLFSLVVLPVVGALSMNYTGLVIVSLLITATLATYRVVKWFLLACWSDIQRLAVWLKKPTIHKAKSSSQWQQHRKQQKSGQRQQRQEKTYQDPRQDFDPSRFGGSAHYGAEKHHPDDSRLWNVINDPNASENEQMNALRKIKKREARRSGGTGQEMMA